jgi:hypothetical protein
MDAARAVTTRPMNDHRSALARRWARRTPLVRDVTVILIVKAIVLGLLWLAFFRTPAAPNMKMDRERVEQRLLAPPPLPEAPHAVP